MHISKKRNWLSRLIYRQAVENLNLRNSNGEKYLFAGFNALNALEEKLFNILLPLIKLKYIGMLIKLF
jgi:hypothetical protein